MSTSQSEKRPPEDLEELTSKSAWPSEAAQSSLFGTWSAESVALAPDEVLRNARAEYERGRYGDALRLLESLTSASMAAKELASAWALRARASARLGRLDASAQAAAQATTLYGQLYGDHGDLSGVELHDYAIALYLTGQLTEAAPIMADAIAHDGATPELYVYQGVVERELGRFTEAVTALERARAVDPPDLQLLRLETLAAALAELGPDRADEAVRTYYQLADVYYRASRFAEALASLEGALAIAPEDLDALAAKGECLIRLGRFEESIEVFDAALAISPEHAWVLARKGAALFLANRPEEALAALDKSLSVQPDDAWALAQRGEVLLILGRYKEALVDLDEALALRPANVWTLKRRGETLRMLGRYSEALSELDKVLSDAPDDTWALASKGETLRMLGRAAEAEEILHRVLKLEPGYLFAEMALGSALLDQGREQEALRVFKDILEHDSTSFGALEGIVFAYQRLDDMDRGLAAVRQLLELKPEHAWAHGVHGNMLWLIADYQAAARELEKATELDPSIAWAQSGLGECYSRLSLEAPPAEMHSLLEKALAANLKSVELNREDLLYQVELAETLRKMGEENLRLAQEVYRSALVAGETREKLDFNDARHAGWAAFRLASNPDADMHKLLVQAEELLVEALGLKKDRPASHDALEVKLRLALTILCSERFGLALREYGGALKLASERQPAVQYGLFNRARTDLREALTDWPQLRETKHVYKVVTMLEDAEAEARHQMMGSSPG